MTKNLTGKAPALGRAWRRAITLLLLVAAIGHHAGAEQAGAQQAGGAPIPVELNKLEPLPAAGGAPAGCRIYIVVGNPDPDPIAQLRLDLILFGSDGVIARRVALDLGPLPPRKTAVRLFDLQGQPCDGIGRVLVNDVLGCQPGGHGDKEIPEAHPACLDRLQLSSRARAELTK